MVARIRENERVRSSRGGGGSGGEQLSVRDDDGHNFTTTILSVGSNVESGRRARRRRTRGDR